jgi:hypothetical protein
MKHPKRNKADFGGRQQIIFQAIGELVGPQPRSQNAHATIAPETIEPPATAMKRSRNPPLRLATTIQTRFGRLTFAFGRQRGSLDHASIKVAPRSSLGGHSFTILTVDCKGSVQQDASSLRFRPDCYVHGE